MNAKAELPPRIFPLGHIDDAATRAVNRVEVDLVESLMHWPVPAEFKIQLGRQSMIVASGKQSSQPPGTVGHQHHILIKASEELRAVQPNANRAQCRLRLDADGLVDATRVSASDGVALVRHVAVALDVRRAFLVRLGDAKNA